MDYLWKVQLIDEVEKEKKEEEEEEEEEEGKDDTTTPVSAFKSRDHTSFTDYLPANQAAGVKQRRGDDDDDDDDDEDEEEQEEKGGVSERAERKLVSTSALRNAVLSPIEVPASLLSNPTPITPAEAVLTKSTPHTLLFQQHIVESRTDGITAGADACDDSDPAAGVSSNEVLPGENEVVNEEMNNGFMLHGHSGGENLDKSSFCDSKELSSSPVDGQIFQE